MLQTRALLLYLVILGELLLSYILKSDASLIVNTKGTKEPVYSKDAGRYAKACPESRGKATVSYFSLDNSTCFSISLTQCTKLGQMLFVKGLLKSPFRTMNKPPHNLGSPLPVCPQR